MKRGRIKTKESRDTLNNKFRIIPPPEDPGSKPDGW